MRFDVLPSTEIMVALKQLNSPSSWGPHRRALTFAVIGLFSFSTLLWLARGLVYDLSSVRGLPGQPIPFRPKAGVSVDGANTTQSSHAAVVIETSETVNLVPLMLHFSNVLGPTWPIILYTLQKDWEVPPSHAFRRALRQGRIRIHYLPRNTDLSTTAAVSTFLTRPWFWEQLVAYDRVLLFQTDSVLCSRAPGSVDDYLIWDFVGAPTGGMKPGSVVKGYNGGLSLRNPARFLEIAKEGGFNPYIEKPERLRYEDQWFYQRLTEKNSTLLPPMEEARKFSVETVYYETPLGFHQPQRWQSDYMDDIELYCPEVNIMLDRRIPDDDDDDDD